MTPAAGAPIAGAPIAGARPAAPAAACGHALARLTGGCPLCRNAPAPRPATPPPPEERPHVPITLDHVVAERCKRSFAYYVRRQWDRTALASIALEWGWHLDAICAHIQGQIEDAMRKRADPSAVVRAQNLLINCPPRSLKTILMTLANAWAWIRWPFLQILYLSANAGVVLDSARLFRDVVTGDWYQRLFVLCRPASLGGAWRIRDDQDALQSIGNTAGGARRARAWGSEIIGLNADWLVADDAHAMDDTTEEIAKAIEKYDGDISSRMNDSRWGFRTAIMQRARPGDFSEHVINLGWFHLRIPMGFKRRPKCRCTNCELGVAGLPNAFGWKDPRQEEGEVMHQRYTPEYLAERLATLRAHGYAGQMEQEPGVKEGNQFKLNLWKYFQIKGGPFGPADGTPRTRPRGITPEREREPARVLEWSDDVVAGRARGLLVDWVEVSIDPTGGSKEKTASALGIGIIVGKGERRFVLEDFTPGPAGWHEALKFMKAAVARASDLTGWISKIVVRIEHKALGEGMIQDLREAIGNGLVNAADEAVIAVVKDYEPTGKGDKSQRSEFMEPMLEAGLMYLLDGASWLTKPPGESKETFVDEFAAFPHGSRDDRIDYMSQCLSERRAKKAGWVSLFGKAA